MPDAPPKLTGLIPMLSVADLERTRAFYCELLGFEVVNEFGSPPAPVAGPSGRGPEGKGQLKAPEKIVWCMLRRDGVRLMFNRPEDGFESKLPYRAKDFQIYYIYPDDVRGLHAAWQAKGVPVSDLRVTGYGMREFELRDPDGYWLWFGQSTGDPPTVEE